MAKPAYCPRPTYGRILGSTLVSNLSHAVFTGAGAFGGYLIGRRSGSEGAIKGTILGGLTGFVGGFYPAMLIERGVLRSAGCPQPSMLQIFGYRLASGAAMAALGFTARKILPGECEVVERTGPVPSPDGGTMVGYLGQTERCRPDPTGQMLAAGIGTFTLPLLGKLMLRDTDPQQ